VIVANFVVAFSFVTLSFSIGAAQERTEQSSPPATKLEAFQARTGVVLIRGFTTTGTIVALYGALVRVDAREFRDASNSTSHASGVSIEVKDGGRLERENTSFVDADEIDSLLKGIDYIMKIGKDITKHENFEADYRTRGELRITVFSKRGTNDISAAIVSGRIGPTRAFMDLTHLEEFRRLVVAAKAKL
jgi:hypothetical protein